MPDLKYDSTRRALGPAHSILWAYCRLHGITLDDLRGPSRKQPLAAIRQDCMAEIYHSTSMSTTQIGKILNRDHTTICHGIKASEARL